MFQTKKAYFFLLFLILFISVESYAQIQSISGSGLWSESTTWLGGVVPGENDDVIINGNIAININTTIKNLSVTSAGVLYNLENNYPDLYVKGNLVNNGTIKDHENSGYIDLYLYGNVTNHGTFSNYYLTLKSNSNQYMGGEATYQIQKIQKVPDGIITASSNLNFGDQCRMNIYYDTLYMQNYKLTTNSTKDKQFNGGVVHSNGDIDITGAWASSLDGNFTLTGSNSMQISSNISVLGNLTVGQGKVLENYENTYPDLTVIGNIVNNGTIRNNPNGGYVDLYLKGNVTNNGNFSNTYLTFNSNENQFIGGESTYQIETVKKIPDGVITASSNLNIGDQCTFDIHYDTLYMQNYKLTTNSSRYIKFNSGIVHSNGQLDVTGSWGSDLAGNFTLVGTSPMLVTSNITVYDDFTVGSGKVIENEEDLYPDITVIGNIINNGTIRNHPDGGYIDLYLKGNVTNNGDFSNSYLTFSSNENQYIGGESLYQIKTLKKIPDGVLTAASDLNFGDQSKFNMHYDTLYMQKYKLTTNSTKDNRFLSGIVYSNGNIDVTGAWSSDLGGEFTFVGDSTMQFYGNISVHGDLTIGTGKIVENLVNQYPDLYVKGDFINYGTLRDNPEGGYIDGYFSGNFFNNGLTTLSYSSHYCNGKVNSLSGIITTQTILNKPGDGFEGSYIIEGNLYNKEYFRLNSGAELEIPVGASLIVDGKWYNYASVNNKGELQIMYTKSYTGDLDVEEAQNAEIYITDIADADTFKVAVHNNSFYPYMRSSINRWWSFNGNHEVGSYYLTLKYDDSILNGQNENELDVFITPDSGETWQKMSNPVNKVIDTENNTITVGTYNQPVDFGYGDIIVSSGNISKVPQIALSVTGKRDIRVGPPNRYSITYWNNSDFSTDDFFVELNTNRGVHIMSVISKDKETGEDVEIPIDSLTFSGVNDEVFLYIHGMEPEEVRTFDVILGAVPDGSTLAKTKLEPITLTAAAIWLGGALVKDYIGNVAVEGCYEMWRPVRHDESLTDASLTALKNSMGKAATLENGLKTVAKEGAESIVKRTGKAALWPAGVAMDLYDCLKNTVKGMKDYVNGNFDKKGKELRKVTSWDPNAKEGPAGYGPNGYMATNAPMNYTIFFENKKEATAPAWKIVILDTLDENVYDISSVKFGKMSHDMGTVTQEGNILRWEFVNIELPPNVNPPEGEGFVKFTVDLKPELPTGTEIKNKAVITFDLNKPIETNVAVNTLDFDCPETEMVEVEFDKDAMKAKINWQINDNGGSGGSETKIYMSKNNMPFVLAAKSDSSSAKIDVEPEVPYKFYLITKDNVGNIEEEYTIYDKVFTGVEDEKVVPKEYKLAQNYPNPFNPSTTIVYDLPVASHVNLSIFNVLGERLATLTNEVQRNGRHRIRWNATKLSTGVYFYKLEARSVSGDKEFIEVKKLMLLK